MLQKNKICLLVFSQTQTAETGDYTVAVESGNWFIAPRDIVGLQTQLTTQSLNVLKSCSFELDRRNYNGQIYVGVGNILYEVANVTKAKNQNNCLLIVSPSRDDQRLQAYLTWKRNQEEQNANGV